MSQNSRNRHDPGKRGPKAGSLTKSFIRWLKCKAPIKLRVETEEGDKVVKVTSNRWRTLEETVLAFDPIRVEALDEAGECLGVWNFPQVEAPAADPGYTLRPDDTPEERNFKVVANLLADAYRTVSDKLVNVIELQSRHFAEERKAFSGTLLTMDRAMSRVTKLGNSTRVRVVASEDDDEEREGNDDFMRETLMPIIAQKMANGIVPKKEGSAE